MRAGRATAACAGETPGQRGRCQPLAAPKHAPLADDPRRVDDNNSCLASLGLHAEKQGGCSGTKSTSGNLLLPRSCATKQEAPALLLQA